MEILNFKQMASFNTMIGRLVSNPPGQNKLQAC